MRAKQQNEGMWGHNPWTKQPPVMGKREGEGGAYARNHRHVRRLRARALFDFVDDGLQ